MIDKLTIDSLVLTLGHGSSAIAIKDNKIVNGYQNERITRIKSDSQFPIQAIQEIEKFHTIPDDVTIYISHWEPTGDVFKMSPKHFHPEFVKGKKLVSIGKVFTHHDTHAASVIAYAKDKILPNSHIIVADGFGNFGEVTSIYEAYNGCTIPIHTYKGYFASLGLWYQYATDFCGFKMNQDEWKLNALAASATHEELNNAQYIINDLYDVIMHNMYSKDTTDYSFAELDKMHKYVHEFLSIYFIKDDAPIIATVLQETVQQILKHIIQKYNIKNLLLAGGCFMNVQLNGYLAQYVDSICIMPLSGDCGAGLGLYKMYNYDFVIPDDLCFGLRPEIDTNKYASNGNLIFTSSLQKDLYEHLCSDKIVNVVRGKMEFGERAYCNTSTIALPTERNAKYIGHLNERHEIMPLCPVMNRYTYEKVFGMPCDIIRSVEHMIIALEYNDVNDRMIGAAYNLRGIYSGRPQVIDEGHYIHEILKKLPILINTSFNVHGQPIVYNIKDVIMNHSFQQVRDYEKRTITLVEVQYE
jgi:carbamoyltransferase